MRPGLVIASVAILASGGWCAQASAAPVGYSVAKIQDIARIGGVNDLDQIVFETGGGKVLSLYDGGTLTALTPAVGAAEILFGATLNNAGQIAYHVDNISGGGSTSLRILDGGTSTTIASASQPGFSSLDFDASKINESGQVAYTDPLPSNFATVGGRSLFLWNGSASVTLVDAGVADGDFFSVAGAGLNNSGLVAFSANKFVVSGMSSGTTEASVFVNDGATNTVVIDGPNGPFKTSATAAINDSGQIVFLGIPDGGNNAGLYITDGATTDLIADLLDSRPDFFVASMNNQGLVLANIATSVNSGGSVLASTLSLFRNGVAEALYSTGDVLDGLVIARIFLGKDAINEEGDFTFALTFTNGTSATYFASALAGQVPLPAGVWMFLAGIGALASSRGRSGRGAREMARGT